jgi:hypothetical protein
MRRGHLRHRLHRLCRLHLQLQLLHIVGILHMALLAGSDCVRHAAPPAFLIPARTRRLTQGPEKPPNASSA